MTGRWSATRYYPLDELFALTREPEEAMRQGAEVRSSVALRVQMLESNMRSVEAYDNASSQTQRTVEGAVIERPRRRANILHSDVDDNGRPLDVHTDDEADEDVRRGLFEEGHTRIDAPAGQSHMRARYALRDSATPEVLRFVSPEPFVPHAVEEATTEILDAETSSDEETVPAEPGYGPSAQRDELVAQLQGQIDEFRSLQSPEERVRQEGQEHVWYYRRAREIALQDTDATTPPVTGRAERARVSTAVRMAAAAAAAARTNHASSVWVHQSVRTDMKALLHSFQQKLDEEIDASRGGQSFAEGSYLELSDLLRDMFLCVERI